MRRVGVHADGLVDLDALEAALDERTAVVSVMLVNNEVGTIQPLAEVATLVRLRSPHAVLHTDAVQAVPWIDVATAAADAQLVAISAHKFGGPKGVGALVVRDGTTVRPLLEGGGQERGLRAGTVNVAGAVAMAAALSTTVERRADDVRRVAGLRDRLVAGLTSAVPRHVRQRRPGTARWRGTATSGSAASRPRRCSSRSTARRSTPPPALRAHSGCDRALARARRRWVIPRGGRARLHPPQPRVRVHVMTDVDRAVTAIPAAVDGFESRCVSRDERARPHERRRRFARSRPRGWSRRATT